MTASARLPGVPVVLAGPSGGGKTSVCEELVRRRTDVAFSISATTRAPRADEVDGRHYRFVDRERFERMTKAGELLEWAEVHGEMYGTPRDQLDGLREGRSLLLDIDVQGARDVRRRVPESVLVFLLPPSAESMLARLRNRGSEDDATLRRRMRTALAELEAVGEFDYAVVNEDLDTTVDAVEAILEAERRAIPRLGATIAERADALATALRGALE
ncbi:MAG: guanylate kinase [Gemmatimonadota bacterium]